jgi:hypothetical protein
MVHLRTTRWLNTWPRLASVISSGGDMTSSKIEKTESGDQRSSPRELWPIRTPFAESHILLTRGTDMGHWVAMDDKGEIFDPVRGRGKQIAEYDVSQIVGIWRK